MDQKSLQILIVDDSFLMTQVIGDILKKLPNIEVAATAKSGEEAIQKAQSLNPDIITLDYELPGIKGSEVIRKILAGDNKKTPKIIVISAYGKKGSEVTTECLNSGAFSVIPKTEGELSEKLLKKIQEILKG